MAQSWQLGGWSQSTWFRIILSSGTEPWAPFRDSAFPTVKMGIITLYLPDKAVLGLSKLVENLVDGHHYRRFYKM